MIDLFTRILFIMAVFSFGSALANFYKGDTFGLSINLLSVFLTVGFLFVFTEKKKRG